MSPSTIYSNTASKSIAMEGQLRWVATKMRKKRLLLKIAFGETEQDKRGYVKTGFLVASESHPTTPTHRTRRVRHSVPDGCDFIYFFSDTQPLSSGRWHRL